MHITKIFLKKYVIVNSTKTTLPVFRIAISYHDEESFSVINKIILLFKWMKINVIFEPIEIAGDNYKKFMKYGIDEENLTRLTKTNLLIHISFDYSSYNKSTQVKTDEYLQNFFQIVYQTYVKNNVQYKKYTHFFEKNKQYIANIDDFKEKNITNKFDDKILINYDFVVSKGQDYSIFELHNYNDIVLIAFCTELLKYLNLNEKLMFFTSQNNIDNIIKLLKKNSNNTAITSIDCDKIEKPQEIIWNELNTIYPEKLTDEITKLEGKFQINQLVEKIKNRQIKIKEGYSLYQILADDIEYYPNINFWNKTVINPIIKITKIDMNVYN